MKRVLILFALFFVAIILQAQVEPTDTDGNGYRNISTLDHLRWVSENSSSWTWNFELDNDIDAGDTKNWNEGKGWSPIGTDKDIPFKGKFNGNNKKIDSLYINRPKQDYVGIFGCTFGSTIKNIILTNCFICGYENIAALVGYSSDYSTVTNSSVGGGIVSGNSNIGGLVGMNHLTSFVINNSSQANISGNYNVGGLIGSNVGTISNSYTRGSITGNHYVGGLVGKNYAAYTINCFSTADITGKGNYIGGLVGYSSASIIKNSYSTGSVLGSLDVGGFIGMHTSGTIINCFWDTQTSGWYSSAGGIGKTTKEMKTSSTFINTNWNFDYIWKIDSSYPYIDIDMSYAPIDTDNDGSLNIVILTDLQWLSESGYYFDKKWELDNDINTKVSKNWNNGLGFPPIKIFKGKFDGNGYRIINLYINRPQQNNIAFFACTYDATIVNIGITNCEITGEHRVGALAGNINYNTIITNSYSNGNISGNSEIGGLVGISSSFSAITNCYSNGNTMGSNSIGGIVGHINATTIRNCYSNDKVTGYASVGGLVGWCMSSSMSNNYFSGSIYGEHTNIAGIAGNRTSTNIRNSFWDIEKSRLTKSSGGNGGKTTAQMKTKSTFTDANWDFTNIWNMDPKINEGYPFLRAVPVSVLEELSEENNTISLYPNPIFRGNLINITFERLILNYTIKIYNMEGILVADYLNNENIQISADFMLGTYFLIIESGGEIIASEKFIVR